MKHMCYSKDLAKTYNVDHAEFRPYFLLYIAILSKDKNLLSRIYVPVCHELWNNIYPLVYALQNGADLDYGNVRAKMFDAKCPDECRVNIHGETMED